MKIIKRVANKLGLRTPKYRHIAVKTPAYITFKTLAAQNKMNYIDFMGKLLECYIACKEKNHEAQIADLLKKQDILVDELKLYRKRVGKIYRSPTSNIPKTS